MNAVLPLPSADWAEDYRAARMTTAALLARLGLSAADFPAGVIDDPAFAVKVPPHWLSLMQPGNPRDPLLLQVLARGEEALPGGVTDPLAEAEFRAGDGIIRKYGSRALLLASGACAIHCRYCFRRHYDYGDHAMKPAALEAAIDRLAADPAIEEVILSGGDPLSLSDARLAAILAGLARLPNLAAVRIHSRTATTVPARITDGLLAVLAAAPAPVVIVTHSNHAQELDDVVAGGLARLREAGVTLLNQAVLLAGVNDDVATMAAHCRRLWAAGVLPYYVHLLDPVAGAGHFDVPLAHARALEQGLRDTLSGYLVPRFVREVPGQAAKTPLWQL